MIPGGATGEKDGMHTIQVPIDGDPEKTEPREVPLYQGIDQSKAVPDLVAAVQELAALVAAQAEEIAALQGGK